VDLSKRLRETVRKEVSQQLRSMGGATQDELDALRKRVRDLERAAGMTASGRASAARKTAARSSTPRRGRTKKTAARTTTARKTTGARRTPSSAS
jgi:Skp family chaperone for outer membrane proteins